MDTSKIRKPAKRNYEVVGFEEVRTGSLLPKEVSDIMKNLDVAERNAYFCELYKAGWTLESIAKAHGNLTRERVRQIINMPLVEEAFVAITHLPIPELPKREVLKATPKQPDPEVLKQLLVLKEKAFWVRGNGKNNRVEAEEYTRLIAEQIEQGVTCYTLAKALGVTTGAIYFRLVRYGYKSSTGNTKVFRQVHQNNRATQQKEGE